MFQTLRNAWKIKDLRYKMLFSLFIIILYRIGASIPMPYVNANVLNYFTTQAAGSILQYINILSGNAFAQATLFALGINPYITSSIVMQLLTIAIPALERLSKEGEEGKKKITQITRYVTVGLALITSYGYYMFLRNNGFLNDNGIFAAVVIIAAYCAGSALVMWLSEKIEESGIGNGISLILFANIVSRGGTLFSTLITYFTKGFTNADGKTSLPVGIVVGILTIVIALAIITFIVFMSDSERRIPIQYAKKVVGRKMYGGQSSNLPLKLNMTGVMPIIFANSILSIPATIALFFKTPKEGSFWAGFLSVFSSSSWVYAIIFFVLIIAFAYFYVAISFNPIEVANNLKNNGGFVPGIRPGKPTAEYITKILNRVTLIGAVFLGVIAAIPIIVNAISGGAMGEIAFSGSSIIIVVGVVLETAREIEAQMTMRHYKGFLE